MALYISPIITLCFDLKIDLSTSMKIDSNKCFGRAKFFLTLYCIVFNIYMLTLLPSCLLEYNVHGYIPACLIYPHLLWLPMFQINQ